MRGNGGRMTEGPRVHVRAKDLGGEAPVALRDSLSAYDLAIDFSYPPERIAEALTLVMQECVDSRRWNRVNTGEHAQPDDEPPSQASGHPDSDR
jgi:hypothetical protein